MFQKQLRQCNFIRKSKPNSSLVLQAKISNANKMLITQRLCAFLALAQLLRNFVFFSLAPFPLTLLIHASHHLRFSLCLGKKPLDVFTCLEDIFFASTISILQTTEEFMPINLGRSICGRIKDITSSNPKSTDFLF